MNNKEQSQQQPEEQTGTVNIYGIYVEGKRELTDGQTRLYQCLSIQCTYHGHQNVHRHVRIYGPFNFLEN